MDKSLDLGCRTVQARPSAWPNLYGPSHDSGMSRRAHGRGAIGFHAAACDVLEPWAHGTVVRATRYEGYWDLNVVRVEDEPGMTVGELIAFTDDALAGLAHRRIDFEQISVGDEASRFEALGWRTLRLLYLRHESPPPPGPEIVVEQVPYDAVYGLRASWSHEDLPGQDPTAFIADAREVAMRRDVQVLAVHDGGAPIAYAQIEREGSAAEITQVYVHPITGAVDAAPP